MIIDYWLECLAVQALSTATTDDFQNCMQFISRTECDHGQLQEVSIKQLVAAGHDLSQSFAIAPLYAYSTASDELFIPYFLMVKIAADGEFKVIKHISLPIMVTNNLEGHEFPLVCLGTADNYANYFNMQPPIWKTEEAQLTWKQMLNYARSMLGQVSKGLWQAHLQKLEYKLSSGALLIPISAMQNKFIAWQRHKLQELRPQADVDFFIKKITQNTKTIRAARRAGKTKYAKKFIIDSWIKAAVDKQPPPNDVWIKYNETPKITNIFEALSDHELYLTKHIRKNIVGVDNSSDFSMSYTIQDFLSVCSNILQHDLVHLEQAKEHLNARLVNINKQYQLGKKLLQELIRTEKELAAKYYDKGGLLPRIKQLQENLSVAQANTRHLQVLESVWQRQVELTPSWPRWVDAIPGVHRHRVHKLLQFFKHNFPDEQVHGLNQVELNALIRGKAKSAAKREHFIADMLHTAENENQQLQILKDKCLAWFNNNLNAQEINLDIARYKEILLADMYPQVQKLAIKFWEAELLLQMSWNSEDANNLKSYFNYGFGLPERIDLLIIEHAEYCAVPLGIALLTSAKQAILMGDEQHIISPNFAPQIDYEIADFYGLALNDAEYEDLELSGKAVATGNVWDLVKSEETAEIDFNSSNNNNVELSYEFVDVQSYSEPQMGSRVNVAETRALVAWLQSNSERLLSYYTKDEIIIYTTHFAQLRKIKQEISTTPFANIRVKILQEPNLQTAAISILLPVYGQTDSGPYLYDKGKEIFANLVANTRENLIIIGAKSLFNPKLHSASGNFAKLFIKVQQEEQSEEQSAEECL